VSNTPAADTLITCNISDSFAALLANLPGSIAVTTYQAGKVALIGHDGHQVTLLLRQFEKPMGLAVRDQTLALATRHQVTLFANAPLLAHDYLENQPGRYDALFLPRAAYYTGDVNVHDLAFADSELWVVNTRFCCLCTLGPGHSFTPRWKPPFLSDIAPEDRCHLNGLAIVNNQPKYVTALGATDAPGAWRENKAAGGVIIDVPSNEILARGLCMPHSPRFHNGQLYFLNSGTGELCTLDLKNLKVTPIVALPAYLRGLSFAGPYAILGLCQIREKHVFGNLPIQQRVKKLLCGVAIVDLRTGKHIATLEFTTGCQELYEVQFVPNARRPTILNLEKQATRHAFTAPEFSYWLRPSNQIK
jgi:uncharacterized protein (TIGR03032 family)